MSEFVSERIRHLQQRAARLRIHALQSTGAAGSGHPSSCLSAADLVAAVFFHAMRYDPHDPGNPAADRFVLSKGHAAPLLYAAWAEAGAFPVERLSTLRRLDSELEGHPTPRFPGTVAATGSLGQGLSIAFGLAWAARYLEHSDQRIFVLLGDGEMAEGAVWEAVELSAHYRLDNLVALVDVNGWGQSERTMHARDVGAYARRFEAFGWRTRTIDGHDMAAILDALEHALHTRERPMAIIARTIKGKGVSLLEDRDNWHGKPVQGELLEQALAEVRALLDERPLPPVERRCPPRPEPPPPVRTEIDAPAYEGEVATREAYGNALVKLGAVETRVVVLDGDTKNSTYAQRFAAAYPDRYLEAYIAEQNMIGAGVGLSAAGKLPFCSTFASFHTRAFDQIRMAAISRANLKLAGSHAGVSIGPDGPSQMGLEDIAMMRAIPGAAIFYPADGFAAERLTAEMAAWPGIAYIRLTRPKTPLLYSREDSFPAGGCKVLRSSDRDVATVVAAGITVFEALRAADRLAKEGIAVRVVDLYSIRPIDRETLAQAAAETGRIITVEDHYADGGLGDAVLDALAETPVPLVKLAVREVPRSGTPEELLHWAGIDADAVVAQVRAMVGASGKAKAASG